MTDPADEHRRRILEENAALLADDEDNVENEIPDPGDDYDDDEPTEEDTILPNITYPDEFEGDPVTERDETRKKYYGRDGFPWSTSRGSSITSPNLRIIIPGRRGPAESIMTDDPLKMFELFVSDEIVDIIVRYTNERIIIRRAKFDPPQRYTHDTSRGEVKALIGLLLFSGMIKNNLLPTKDLFNLLYSPSVFKSSMTANRFEFLINCLRFDDAKTRAT
jgi:hypothetical protein